MNDDDRTLTEADLEVLDQTAVRQMATLARTVSWLLVAAGVLGTLAWFWVSLRGQQTASAVGLSTASAFADGESVPLADRITLFTGQVPILLLSGIVAGVGLLLRAVADHVQLASGSSPLGLQVGDPWPAPAVTPSAPAADAEDEDEDEAEHTDDATSAEDEAAEEDEKPAT